ncbi:complement factor H-like [Eucyclogobius newberryi]|uniref:complement factor H-like n=1 Tax=Eucyclogobius newberryi TaxID=166745 RepID=UPI003B58D142
MGHHKRFLAALTTLFCIFQSGVSEASSCSDLRSLENGQTFFRYNGLFVIFSCRHGYRLLGHKTSSCVSGRWSREPPVCVGSGCPSPGPVAHGSFSVNRDASWVVFSCDTGHKLIGPSTLYCKGSEWNSSQPVCEEEEKSDIGRTSSCPEPPVPAHGAFYFGNKEREKGDHIVYVCAHGFTLDEGDAFRHCQEGATWSGVTPVCKDVDECIEGKHHCQHRCINTPGSYLCSCHHGYQPSPDGTSCTDLDECAFPAAVTGCLFGCVNSPGSFHCLCPSGFTTQSPDGHCQDIDECVEHGGLGPCSERCHNSPGSFHCSCSYGFTLAGDGRTCISECPKGYRKAPIKPHHSTAPPTGRCEDINECDDVGWCEGRCINLPGTFRCVCPRGFTLTEDKRRCKDINECSQNNGGCSHVCINRRRTFKCVCPPSYRPSSSSWSKCVPRLTL